MAAIHGSVFDGEGGGASGALLRAHDWAATPLGPIAGWSLALRLHVETALASAFPACVFWGPELIAIHNDAFLAIVADHREPLGQPMRLAWSDVWEAVGPMTQRTLAGEAVFIEDHEMLLSRQGVTEPAWFTFCFSPLREAGGGVAGMLSTVVETTAKQLATRRAAEKRARLKRLNAELEKQVLARTLARGRIWEVTPELLCVMGFDGRIQASNPAWGTLLGWTDEDLAGRLALDSVHPEDQSRLVSRWRDVVFRGLTAERFEVRFRARDGGWRWLSWIAVPHEGKVYCSARDVQAEKEDAAALALRTAERDLLAGIVESSGTQIQVVGLDGRLLAINRASADEYERVLGARPAVGDLLMPYFDRLADPRDREIAIGYWRRAMAGECFTLQRSFHDPDLAGHHLELVLASLVDAAGTRIGTYAIVTDTSARVAEQRALLDAQEALRQSQKMEAVGQLTGGIAHDVNNLLAAISGSLQVIRSRLGRGRTDGLERYLDMGDNGVQRAASLTQRLLAFSRRQTLDPTAVDLNRLVHGMEEMIRRSVGPAIALEVETDPALWTTRVDAPQLESALLNLCINARDAMLPAGGTLRIATENALLDARGAAELGLEAGAYVVLVVTDSGIGIDPDALQRIFDPFFTTKPLGKGTGLGLSMVYGFAQQSGGQVRAWSRVGHGTTMRLILPRHVGVPLAGATTAPPTAPAAGRGETVLVVEDEAPIRALLVEALGEAGYRVLQAEDGPAGVRLLEAPGPIDLLVSDVGLPGGLNGRQVADAGRRVRPGLPVVFVTGYVGDDAAVGNGRMEPGMSVLTKPFEIDALLRRVRELLAGRARAVEPPELAVPA